MQRLLKQGTCNVAPTVIFTKIIGSSSQAVYHYQMSTYLKWQWILFHLRRFLFPLSPTILAELYYTSNTTGVFKEAGTAFPLRHMGLLPAF